MKGKGWTIPGECDKCPTSIVLLRLIVDTTGYMYRCGLQRLAVGWMYGRTNSATNITGEFTLQFSRYLLSVTSWWSSKFKFIAADNRSDMQTSGHVCTDKCYQWQVSLSNVLHSSIKYIVFTTVTESKKY